MNSLAHVTLDDRYEPLQARHGCLRIRPGKPGMEDPVETVPGRMATVEKVAKMSETGISRGRSSPILAIE